MVQWYLKANRNWPKILWWIVISCMLLSLPLAAERYRMEGSANRVEVVFDYRDLLEIANTKPDPRAFIDEQLINMKRSGIQSLAVYESTLSELQLAGRVQVFNSQDAALLNQTASTSFTNSTYVLFTDPDSQSVVQDMITRALGQQKVSVQPWTYHGTPGVVIGLPYDDAMMKPLDPDPITLKTLKDRGFGIVIRLGNRKPFSEQEMDHTLRLLSEFGVKTMLVDGDSVPGVVSDSTKTKKNLDAMAGLLEKYDMTTAVIEPVSLGTPQKGISTIAKETGYHVVRLHSISERDADKLAEILPEQDMKARILDMSDRLVLAVKDRNIRMIFINGRAVKNIDRGVYSDPLDSIYKTLKGTRASEGAAGYQGALQRIVDDGFSLGTAHPFQLEKDSVKHLFRPFAYLGSIALIALTLSYFFPWSSLLVTILGLLGSGALYVVSPGTLDKLLALGATSFAAALGLILAFRRFRSKAGADPERMAPLKAVWTLIWIVAVSSIGMALVVGLLFDITYNLQIDQFKGVKILAYLPILVAAVYLVFFSEGISMSARMEKLRRMLEAKISVLWVISAAVIGLVGLYYLSRTGNEGAASPIEMMFRSFLEHTMGVRPRTKEFLLAHPLLVFGAYLALRRKMSGLYVMLLGAVGQASAVGTFTHIHTPLMMSFLRVMYGTILGAVIGLILIAAWELLVRGWNRWARL